MAGTIKNILVEAGEDCNVDVAILHDALLKLPAEKYIELYNRMKNQMEKESIYYSDDYCRAFSVPCSNHE